MSKHHHDQGHRPQLQNAPTQARREELARENAPSPDARSLFGDEAPTTAPGAMAGRPADDRVKVRRTPYVGLMVHYFAVDGAGEPEPAVVRQLVNGGVHLTVFSRTGSSDPRWHILQKSEKVETNVWDFIP